MQPRESITAELPGWCGDQALGDEADAALRTLHGKAPELSRFLKDVPLQETLAKFDANAGYGELRPVLRELSSVLVARGGERLALNYGLALLATLIRGHEERWPRCALDAELEPEFVDSFHRILKAVARGGARSLMLDHDTYHKQLAVCLYRMIPAGAVVVDPASNVPRRLIVRRPTRTTLAAARYLLFKAGGFRPFAAFHNDWFHLRWFSPAGFEHAFQCMPAVFRSFPALKGAVGITWFLDPALEDISPELSFVREIMQRWGAIFVRVGPDHRVDSDALLLSRKRRELFDTGKYVPEVYAFAVSKQDILDRAAMAS